jgi:hypothetical protein
MNEYQNLILFEKIILVISLLSLKKFKNFKIVSGFNYLISTIHLPTKKLKFEFKKKH